MENSFGSLNSIIAVWVKKQRENVKQPGSGIGYQHQQVNDSTRQEPGNQLIHRFC